jgi:L-asparaginase
MDKFAQRSRVLIIYTGGTIGMMKDAETGSLRPFDFDNLMSYVPEIRLLDHEVDTIGMSRILDSSDMTPSSYVELACIIEANYEDYDGFVVLHGSDTMSFTASALSFMFENLQKPVIFTGSQLPIGDLRTDAKENLITSIQFAGLKEKGKPVIREVGLYFEYKLYRANRTTKVNADHFEAFESANYAPARKKFILHKELEENIMILKVFPGITEQVMKNMLLVPDLKGVILETFGSGNTKTDRWFIDLLRSMIDKGVAVVNVTQCIGGSVVMGKYETSEQLRQMGMISGKDITTESALAKLMFLLTKNLTPDVMKTLFETSLRGEISH